jgi:hypothetical protein
MLPKILDDRHAMQTAELGQRLRTDHHPGPGVIPQGLIAQEVTQHQDSSVCCYKNSEMR